jgi:MHS family proline/betaine transporter-like MFS transporter
VNGGYNKEQLMGLLSSLNRQQKEAIGLLQIGTFLEYFDLMLYIHMAVLLNDIFFPKTDAHTASLLAAFAFCSTYIFRPIGALIFGWIGDNIGRKSTIIITTTMMSISCIVMANLPTYEQMGLTATWIMTFCRMAQGMSSMGEMVGANIYIAESVNRPMSYPAVAFISAASCVGAMAALGVATLVTSYYMNWRLAFWTGAIIAIVGAVARTRLRETPDFLELKRRKMKQIVRIINESGDDKSSVYSINVQPEWKQRVEYKTLLSYFLISCGWPLTFYLGYVYFNPMLKDDYGYSAEDIIMYNFFLSILMCFSYAFWSVLSIRIYPLRILKFRWALKFLLLILIPFLLMVINSPIQLFILQSLIIILTLYDIPAEAIFIYHLPIYRRFTYASFLYALSRAVMYIITSFGLVYLGEAFGTYGLWFVSTPLMFAYLYGVLHFEDLERKMGFYPNGSPKLSIKTLKNPRINFSLQEHKNA